uniref:Interleukin-6 n=1 Tax=Gouania willdenowi TaxID=441366 RepID=A0A8C5HP33_GOUWI
NIVVGQTLIECPLCSVQEACFQRLAEGLMVYMVFLKHVEKEYPNNSLLSAAKSYSKVLIPLIKEHVRPIEVTAPTSNQEEQLLKDYDKPADVFYRKMAAHGILHHLRKFLADGKRAIHKREKVYSLANCKIFPQDFSVFCSIHFTIYLYEPSRASG